MIILNHAVTVKVNSENKNLNLKIANKLYNLLAITKAKEALPFNGLALYLGLLENLAVARGSADKVLCAVQFV